MHFPIRDYYIKKGKKDNYKLEPFKSIKLLFRNLPYKKLMFVTYKYYDNYQTDDDHIVDVTEGYNDDVVKHIEYFKTLDNFYRYGVTFEENDIYPENILCVDETDSDYYIIRNRYDKYELYGNEVKTIKLSDYDIGEITLSEIEKWKRKVLVINEEQNMKTKVRLLNPTIYRSLITFYIFSNFKSRPNNEFNFDVSYHEFRKINRIIKNYRYKDAKNMKIELVEKIL